MYKDESIPGANPPIETNQSKWVRASRGGIFHLEVNLGDRVERKQKLGYITDAFGEARVNVRASVDGMVISYTQNPLVNQGDAIVHLAVLKTSEFYSDTSG
jgi:hypothetical protein